MAVQQGIWKISQSADAKPQALREIKLANEALLEQQIVKDISILNANWLLIGQQVTIMPHGLKHSAVIACRGVMQNLPLSRA